MILEAIWFFWPAGVANMVPVLAMKIPVLKDLKAPMDFGKTYKGQRIFGANKTWRGLITGIIFATIAIGIQKYLFDHSLFFLELSWLDYRPASVWLLGPLFGAGALIGDAVESAFKRRQNIAPGNSWFPFDQIDYIVGGCLFSLPIVQLGLSQYLWVLFTWVGVHLLTVLIGYKLGIRDKPI